MPKYKAHTQVRLEGQLVSVEFKRVTYRDSKGRFSKFTTKKKLAVDVWIERRQWNKKQQISKLVTVKSKKYSQPLRKRKKPITLDAVNKRALKKRSKSKIQWVDGMLKITYGWMSKKDLKKERAKKKKAKVKKLSQEAIMKAINLTHSNL